MRKILLVLLLFPCLLLRGHASGMVTLCFTGDIMLDRGVRQVMGAYGPEYPFIKVSAILKSADITCGNLECPLTWEGTPSHNSIILKGDPSNAEILGKSGFDILNIANNHIMDYGPKGYNDTIEALDRCNLLHTDENPVIIEKQDMRIGYIGCTSTVPESLEFDTVKSNINKARKLCDFLVVSFHSGIEYNHYPTEIQKEYSRFFIDCGADIVIGHHPHVLQGFEIYKGKYIFYSIGNFVFDNQIQKGTDETIILNIKIDSRGVREVEILPVKIIKSQPRIVNGDEGKNIIQSLNSYSPSI